MKIKNGKITKGKTVRITATIPEVLEIESRQFMVRNTEAANRYREKKMSLLVNDALRYFISERTAMKMPEGGELRKEA